MLRPLRTFGSPFADQITVIPYTALQSIVENFNPRGMRNYWKALYLNELSTRAIAVMVEQYADVPHPRTHSVLYKLGGAVAPCSAVEDTAVAYRESRHAFIVIGMWSEAADDEQVRPEELLSAESEHPAIDLTGGRRQARQTGEFHVARQGPKKLHPIRNPL